MEYMNDLHNQISDEMSKAIDEAQWGKPASDIITRIESMENAKPARAIWEMVQNARDVSVKEGAEIEFSLEPSEFVFRHNGLPFTAKSLNSLNIQTSSKVRDDIVQVGQYGTGFLTTHKFGMKFDLSGSLELKSCGKFIDFRNLFFDRSTKDKMEMINNLKAQQDAILGIPEGKGDVSDLKDEPCKHTVFSYKQDFDIERERSKEAFNDAQDLTPHVLAMNELINTITYKDDINGIVARFSRSKKQILEQNGLYTLSMVETRISRNFEGPDNQGREYDYQIYMLESAEMEERTNSSKVTVILPLLKEIKGCEERVRVFRFRPNKPNFFIYLPLLGSEQWGVNFLFHSPAFTCADESRSNLRFVGNGQNNDFQADQNKAILALGEEMIFSYIGSHLDSVQDRKMFSFVSLDVNNTNGKLADFYKEKQKLWVNKMSAFPMVASSSEKGGYVLPSSIKGISLDMTKEGREGLADENGKSSGNTAFVDAVYTILATKYQSQLPAKDELIFWSDRFREWYGEETPGHFFSIQDVVNIICSDNKAETVGRENILEFDRFLAKTKQFSFFENYRIVPNEAGILKKKEELVCPSAFSDTTRNVMATLIPDDFAKFVDADFSGLTQFAAFSDEELKIRLSKAIGDIQSAQQTIRDSFHRYCIRQDMKDNVDYPTNYCVKSDEVSALIRYASMVIKPESTSNEAKVLTLVKEFYGFNETITDTLPDFEARSACRTLIQDAFYTFTVDHKEERDDWARRAVDVIYGYSDFRSMLREYKVYKDQSGTYRYCEQLKKENGVPERLKEIYDIIALEGRHESIKDILLDRDYDNCFVGDSECLGSELAAKVFEKINVSPYPNISSYAHSAEVLEIIRRIGDSGEGLVWKALFSTLEADKATITMSIIDNKDKKESIFKLMQEEDTDKLKAIADITEKIQDKSVLMAIAELADEKDLPSILATARRINEERREEERQFNFKYTIGKIIEDELRGAVNERISDYFKISDVQNGQDMVITYKDKPVYYLESKAKWNFTDAAHMSSQQMKQAVREQGHYALCCVDCTADSSLHIDMDASREEVLAAHDSIIANTYVHTDIGLRLDPTISPLVKEEDEDIDSFSNIRVYGSLSCNIPKKVFIDGIPFRKFLDELKVQLQNVRLNG